MEEPTLRPDGGLSEAKISFLTVARNRGLGVFFAGVPRGRQKSLDQVAEQLQASTRPALQFSTNLMPLPHLTDENASCLAALLKTLTLSYFDSDSNMPL